MDTVGFYFSPSIFLALFTNSFNAYIQLEALRIVIYTVILGWIMIQLIAGMMRIMNISNIHSKGLSLFPKETSKLFNICVIFGAFLMTFVGIIFFALLTVDFAN